MTASQLDSNEYLPYFKNYIDQAGAVGLIEGLEKGLIEMKAFFLAIPPNKLEYRYAEDKWTIKEVISHLVDTERIFCYRALRFAREDKTALLGFDENKYVPSSLANDRELSDLVVEFCTQRQSTISLFNSFNNKMLICQGVASGGVVSVRALGFLIIGHEKHHQCVINERYL
ncbi:DinB family protein [Lacinutrix neustonica]|uniref:DinB family protein n=1 Tax=Lacinutrix neustonica TaxID=2980107 RepID=A0A9E8SE35_9FLAO|nr:DinB family protein [Lacinutrix neustonica]WAC02372.1 DinB family protein [Lacinutrix neustonica]